jgi:hypothetical protein
MFPGRYLYVDLHPLHKYEQFSGQKTTALHTRLTNVVHALVCVQYKYKSQNYPTTRHKGDGGRGGIAPTHSRPRH